MQGSGVSIPIILDGKSLHTYAGALMFTAILEVIISFQHK